MLHDRPSVPGRHPDFRRAAGSIHKLRVQERLASGSHRIQLCWTLSFQTKQPFDGTSLINSPAVLESPRERIRDGKITKLRWSAENFIRQNSCCDVIGREHSLREKREGIITIRMVLHEADQSRGRLEVSRSFLLNKKRVKNVQPRSLCRWVVRFFINENEQRITQSENLLPGTLERAGRLGLPNTCNLGVHIQAGEINPLGRTTPWISVTVQKIRLKLVFETGAYGLPVGYSEQARLSVRRFSNGKGTTSFLRSATVGGGSGAGIV